MNTHKKCCQKIDVCNGTLQTFFDCCNVANMTANIKVIVGKIGEKVLLQTANMTASVITIFIYFCIIAKYIYIWGFCKHYFFERKFIHFWKAKNMTNKYLTVKEMNHRSWRKWYLTHREERIKKVREYQERKKLLVLKGKQIWWKQKNKNWLKR